MDNPVQQTQVPENDIEQLQLLDDHVHLTEPSFHIIDEAELKRSCGQFL